MPGLEPMTVRYYRDEYEDGTFGEWQIESPALIRYGELTHDEYFVTEKAAKEGVKITNPSTTDPIVILKHFSDNSDLVIEK